MTETEQQIALCEWWNPGSTKRLTIFGERKQIKYLGDLPDTSSLDVLHEMEKRLDVNQLSEYADWLDKICVPTHICPLTHWQAVVMAEAPQRREALLRTLGLWKS
jgi:hypothetical protein